MNTYRLNQELFETNTLERLKIQAWIVEHMLLLRNKTMAVCAIPRAVEESVGVTEDDMDNISNFPRTVAGVKVAATLRETAEGETKLEGVLFTLDSETGKCLKAERVDVWQ